MEIESVLSIFFKFCNFLPKNSQKYLKYFNNLYHTLFLLKMKKFWHSFVEHFLEKSLKLQAGHFEIEINRNLLTIN